jgi:putative membrane protein
MGFRSGGHRCCSGSSNSFVGGLNNGDAADLVSESMSWRISQRSKVGSHMRKIMTSLANVARGIVMGVAEIVPGVSGGTVALIVGVYHTVIAAAAHVVRAFLMLFSRSAHSGIGEELRAVRWVIVVPVVVGMVSGIFLGAALLEPIIVEYPVETRAVFGGLIVASLWVPIRMVGVGWSIGMLGVAAIAASVSFLLTGLPVVANGVASLWWVAPAAALAVCALVLPGVSGSFLLVTLGMYEPTLAAVNDRDVGYLAVFIGGAVVGLGAFVRVLQWLLEHHQRVTLVVMTGLMAGSLRALWPWQGENRELLAVPDGAAVIWLWVVAGIAVVVAVVALERLTQPRVNQSGPQ